LICGSFYHLYSQTNRLYNQLYTTSVFAQLKVDNIGRTRIGAAYGTTFDDDNQITMALFGNQTNGGGAKLSFGNFRNTANNGMNLFIGEYNNGGNWDSDILQIHGKNAIYFTCYGKGLGILTKFHTPITNPNYDVETGSIVAYSIYTWSDNRLKTNMKTMTGSLDKIKQLRGVTYDLITTNLEKDLESINKTVAKDAKEAEDLDKIKSSLRHKIDEKSKNCLGFSAQEIQAVFPQVVEKDNNGILAVNYTAIIPILVEGIKDQQKIIDDQAKVIDALQKDNMAIKKKIGMQ
jgi:Chaperone of endosialidase